MQPYPVVCAGAVAALSIFVPASPSSAGDLTLEVTGQCPGAITVRWNGAEPNRPLAIIYGQRQGATIIPSGPCGGTQLGIAGGVRLITVIGTRSNGQGSVSGQASEVDCGGYLQLLVKSSPCVPSNVVQIPE